MCVCIFKIITRQAILFWMSGLLWKQNSVFSFVRWKISASYGDADPGKTVSQTGNSLFCCVSWRKSGSCAEAVGGPRNIPRRRVEFLLANDRDTRKSIILPDSSASPVWVLSPSCGSVRLLQKAEFHIHTGPQLQFLLWFNQSNIKADCDE